MITANMDLSKCLVVPSFIALALSISWFSLMIYYQGLCLYVLVYWFCGHTRRDKDVDDDTYEEKNSPRMFGFDEEVGSQVPTQVQTLVEGSRSVLVLEYKPMPNVDYLQRGFKSRKARASYSNLASKIKEAIA